jgi:hypothetical protein
MNLSLTDVLKIKLVVLRCKIRQFYIAVGKRIDSMGDRSCSTKCLQNSDGECIVIMCDPSKCKYRNSEQRCPVTYDGRHF